MYTILFLDAQEETVKHSRTVSPERLIATIGVLARLVALHNLPVFASAVPPGGPYLSPVLNTLPHLTPRTRVETTAYSDKGLVDALKSANSSSIIIAGVTAEIGVQRTALDLRGAGFSVQLAVDAIGGADMRTEDAAYRRMTANGVVTTSVIAIAGELAGDFTTPRGRETLGLAFAAIAAAAM